jgi:hypothetical protein
MSLESLAATARDEETRTVVRAALEGAQLIRQLASDATYLRVASARPLTSISPASYARPGELLERASAPSPRCTPLCTPPGGHDVDASVPASNDFLGKRTAPYLSETPVVTLTR